MLTKEQIDRITRDYKNDYPDQKNFDRALAALDRFYELNGQNTTLTNLYKRLAEMLSASAAEESSRLAAYGKLELFCNYLLQITDPKMLAAPPIPDTADVNAGRTPQWSMRYYLRQGFGLFIKKPLDPETRNEQLKKGRVVYSEAEKAILPAYDYRNMDSHMIEQLSGKERAAMMSGMVVATLVLCDLKRNELEAAYSRYEREQVFDVQAHCSRVVKAYKNAEKNGFGYVELKWYSNNSGCNIEQLTQQLCEQDDVYIVKILGEAGSGKSTALKRIEYLVSANRNKKHYRHIPVFIPLMNLTDNPSVIKSAIALEMGIDIDAVENFLKAGELMLLLDGYNELMDSAIKKKLAIELNAIAQKYPVVIVLSDRNQSEKTYITLSSADQKLYLYQMSEEMKKEFIEKNCHDQAAQTLILDHITLNPDYLFDQRIDTPLKLNAFIETVTANQAIPEDFTKAYLDHLMQREMIEKVEPKVRYLKKILPVLATLMTYSETNELVDWKALSQITKVIRTFGFSDATSAECLELACDMNILHLEDDMVSFASDSYNAYYAAEFFNKDMPESLLLADSE